MQDSLLVDNRRTSCADTKEGQQDNHHLFRHRVQAASRAPAVKDTNKHENELEDGERHTKDCKAARQDEYIQSVCLPPTVWSAMDETTITVETRMP